MPIFRNADWAGSVRFSHPQQDECLGAHEWKPHERRDLFGRERSEAAGPPFLAARDVGQQGEPAADLFADAGGQRRVGPSRSDHLLEDPDVAGLEIGFQEVARLLPLGP